jgi:hypothetical protein
MGRTRALVSTIHADTQGPAGNDGAFFFAYVPIAPAFQTETMMDESTQRARSQSGSSQRAEDEQQQQQEQQRRYVVQFAVAAGETVSLKIRRDAVVSAAGARLWVTRAGDEWDYWLKPGETLRLARDERVWVTGDAGDGSDATPITDAGVTITMYLARRRRTRWKWPGQPAFAL